MTERGSSAPSEPGADIPGGARHRLVPLLRDPSLELFGGTGDTADHRSAPTTGSYTGRHRAPDA